MKVQLPNQMDPERIELLEERTLFQGFFKVIQRKLRHPLFDGGMSQVVTREIFERGNAVVVLPYDPLRDQVVLIEQLRIPAIGNTSHPWLYELVAGMIDKEESVLEVAERELMEETGLHPISLSAIGSHLSSPGGSSERLFMVLAEVDAAGAGGIHGLDHEHEDIRVVVVPRTQAYRMVESGEIDNGSSVIGLQWLELNHHKLGRGTP
ncbi:ADP-ribose diphosphatase [Ferrimonas sediminicola]|uniref:ADP-ribose pyrophosphatase n=1 Tax=Ferrimonas sediminicola TaxID=2569538 RepID=A0A4U1BIW0_9GAMM|nr:ADP-ribose diphosphatase [Ferrimonas sediminicola]TKB51410.1 ADP-ribose diphosphatase [Ferrimonas sediminicola]